MNFNNDRSDQATGLARRMDSSFDLGAEPLSTTAAATAATDTRADATHSATSPPSDTDTTVTATANPPDQYDVSNRVNELARQLTRQSTRRAVTAAATDDASLESTDTSHLFNPEKDSRFDPYSTNFDAKSWARALIGLISDDPNNPVRKAGLAFSELSVHGFGKDTDYQDTVGTLVYSLVGLVKGLVNNKKRKVQILNGFDGLLEPGEMLVVLGPPGSGCSTLLKTMAGEMDGIYLDENSHLNYRGIAPKQMMGRFRGEAIYSAEVDVHFPQLTVGDTLAFAAEARAPRHPPGGLTRKQFAGHLRDVVMAIFGISHTVNTKVGNDFVRGVSGGERKRVSIAEVALSGSPLTLWDNSTRGLDSANAIEFCKTLRMSTELSGSVAGVAIYQAPQSAYDVFDKVTVLYEGQQIYFGDTKRARQFFYDMGFDAPEQATTPDFLTSLTNVEERRARPGYENRVPKTPAEFAAAWKASDEYAALKQQLREYDERYPVAKGEQYHEFLASRRAQQSKKVPAKSPYTLSYGQQIKLCLRRGFKRLAADPSITLAQLVGNSIMSVVVATVFVNLPANTGSFYSRGALLFFAVLLSAFGSALEILTLFAQRPIVERHKRYAFYHPSAEAFASMLTDLPYKITNLILSNVLLYWITGLRRTAGAFFFYLLIMFEVLMAMSMFFRTIASLSRTLSQALAPAAVVILGLLIYAGFAISVPNMLGWASWMRYINPVYWGLASLLLNEFSGREFACSTFVPAGPAYADVTGTQRVCSAVGALPGADTVSGYDYVRISYQVYNSDRWRNFGILIAFIVILLGTYLVAAESVTAKKSKGEVLVFPRGKVPAAFKGVVQDNPEAQSEKTTVTEKAKGGGDHQPGDTSMIQKQTAILHFEDVCYDIKIKKEERRILNHVDGWVKPGTLTCLMGASGAGKTTLLDVLASRVTMGVITGDICVNGRPRDKAFERGVGYVMQQDLHLSTSTVREALQFSALLRQPAHIPRQEKLDYVEETLKLMDMDGYADAVVGVPGEGLNVEQRKRLTIAIELVAKPELLLFLDEPSSGLDSDTSLSIVNLLVKLKHESQALVCVIHQPSAILFERFDRLLFLAKGGRTVYFGDIGPQSSIMTDYFERNGSEPCPKGANPAEWMLHVIGAAPGSHSDIDWHETWKGSPEYAEVKTELATMREELPQKEQAKDPKHDKAAYRQYASSMTVQLVEVTKRIWQQYWRTPSYIYSKVGLCVVASLYIGFSFYKADNSQSGLQNRLFSIFLLFSISPQLMQQFMPQFVEQRTLYEARERPSKTYSWVAFLLGMIGVELVWNTLMAVVVFCCWYFPIGFGNDSNDAALIFAFCWEFLMFGTTLGFMIISAVDTAENGGNIANLVFSMSLIFCGVLATAEQLKSFWVWMIRVSPFTYLVQGILGTAMSNKQVICAATEYVTLDPPTGQTCATYMQTYISTAGGYLSNPDATSNCSFCALSSTNTFLASFDIYYKDRYRAFGLLWVYILFNAVAGVALYWLVRVPKKPKDKSKSDQK